MKRDDPALHAPVDAARRKLWQLPPDCHAPLLGAHFEPAALRVLTDRLFRGRSVLDDAALWSAAVMQCAQRNKVSGALQRELDRRHADLLRRHAAADEPALAKLWTEAARSADVTGALWLVLGHARCGDGLRAAVLQDLQRLQHTSIARRQRDAAEMAALRTELEALRGEAARAQARLAASRTELLAERDALRSEVAALRGRVLGQQALIGQLQAARPDALPPLPREALVRRVAELRRELAALQPQPPAAVADAPATCTADDRPSKAHAPDATAAQERPPAAALHAARVLCVGGRSAQVPLYRALVQRHGGEFEHHDGGIEDGAHRLAEQLAAADLVLCQAGCINHNAYARVKAHCKRHRKPCVFIHKPGAGSFARALAAGARLQPE